MTFVTYQIAKISDVSDPAVSPEDDRVRDKTRVAGLYLKCGEGEVGTEENVPRYPSSSSSETSVKYTV